MATPITVLDSANISVTDNQYIVSITGSVVGQTDLDYLLSAKYSFTGSFIRSVANGGEVGFGYSILQAPTVSPTSSLNYPATTKTDFSFSVKGPPMRSSFLSTLLTLITQVPHSPSSH